MMMVPNIPRRIEPAIAIRDPERIARNKRGILICQMIDDEFEFPKENIEATTLDADIFVEPTSNERKQRMIITIKR
jgi:hypothetical protein